MAWYEYEMGVLTYIHHRMRAAEHEYFELVQQTVGVYVCLSANQSQYICVYSAS